MAYLLPSSYCNCSSSVFVVAHVSVPQQTMHIWKQVGHLIIRK